MRIVVLDPSSSDPAWGPLDEAVVMDVIDPDDPELAGAAINIEAQIRDIMEDPDYLRLDVRLPHVLRVVGVEDV